MTGGNTEAVSTPLYMQASVLLSRLASPLFQLWANAKGPDNPMSVHYNAWFTLRRTAEIMALLRSPKLSAKDAAAMIEALKVCHELAHDNDPCDAPPVELCHCLVSEDLRDLAGLLAEEREMAHAG